MKQKLFILLISALFFDAGRIHPPPLDPYVLVFDWGEIDPNVKIWHSKKISEKFMDNVEENLDKNVNSIAYSKKYLYRLPKTLPLFKIE